MTIESFKAYVKARKALNTEEIHHFMDDMSNEARRITFRLNTASQRITFRTVWLFCSADTSSVPSILY